MTVLSINRASLTGSLGGAHIELATTVGVTCTATVDLGEAVVLVDGPGHMIGRT